VYNIAHVATERYRVTSQTIALFHEGERDIADRVPDGAIIAIDGDAFTGDPFVKVLWNGREIMIFARDLRTRTERIIVAPA